MILDTSNLFEFYHSCVYFTIVKADMLKCHENRTITEADDI